MNSQAMEHIARALAAPGKGILAADESNPTMEKRFRSVGVDNTEQNRLAYREALLSAEGIEESISGVILFDETIRQKTSRGESFASLLSKRGIIPGIKVDKGLTTLSNFPEEKITEGLDGLGARLLEYKELGAKFSKWRAVITIDEGIPSPFCLEANAHLLARFAALSQEAGLTPIVEPEVLMDGDHSLERCEEATGATLVAVFHALAKHRVELEQMLLKPNMALAGKEYPTQPIPEEVARATLRCMKRYVPAAVPGIMFLSGGLSDVDATRNLNALNALNGAPWQLSFSFGRALQAPALKAWAANPKDPSAMQKALLHRARCNGAARHGRYTEESAS